MKKVLTSMVGDLFHVGHLNLLKNAIDLGGELYVGVPSACDVVDNKGYEPIIELEDRLRIIQNIKGVHLALGYEGHQEWLDLIRLIKPDIICRGNDNPNFRGRKIAENLGAKVILFPYTDKISSTKIKEKICLIR